MEVPNSEEILFSKVSRLVISIGFAIFVLPSLRRVWYGNTLPLLFSTHWLIALSAFSAGSKTVSKDSKGRGNPLTIVSL